VEWYRFDSEYVRRLAAGDAETERHFVHYFQDLLLVKLRFRLRSSQEVEDLRQEVFLRVLRSLREPGRLQQPERLGAYVNSVCNNVLLEYYRERGKAARQEDELPEVAATQPGVEAELVSHERQRQVRTLLEELSPKDRNILRSLYLEENDKDRVCREFGVDRDYLRVLLHRARNRFRKLLATAAGQPKPGSGAKAVHK
jgi:RNA polymerase sigma-70 factor (ECF subfamily)